MRLPLPNLPLCHWSSQVFNLRTPSSTDVPVLILNQLNTRPWEPRFLRSVWKKKSTHCLSSLCTRESKLRAFQFKFLHRKIATNDFLYKIGIKQTDSCSFCEEQKETLVHLFWTCKYTQNFWKSMFEWISQNFKDLENVSPSLSLCFGLIDDVKDLLFHHLLLIARHYIYTCRLGNKLPKLQVYIQVLMNSIEIEKHIAFHNNDSNVFVRKWSRFKNNLSQNQSEKGS